MLYKNQDIAGGQSAVFLVLKRLVERTLAQRQIASWRHHQAGMLQTYLAPGTRIHIWHPDLLIPGMHDSGAIHNHRFDFTSTVLVGQMLNDVYALETEPQGPWQRFNVIHASTGKTDDPIIAEDGKRYMSRVTRQSVAAGQTYYFPKWAFHASSVTGLTITLVHKLSQDEKRPAQLLAPWGSSPRHAFANPPVIDTQKYVNMAIEVLKL